MTKQLCRQMCIGPLVLQSLATGQVSIQLLDCGLIAKFAQASSKSTTVEVIAMIP
jgi:hypothetical protein